MPTVLITGGTGTIGKSLTTFLLNKGYQVIILTRHPEKYNSNNEKLSYAAWDVSADLINEEAIEEADYIIHLAGENVATKKWTEQRKKEIVESRVHSSALLVKALTTLPNKVKAVISASAIGWYGENKPNEKQFVETDIPYHDFLGETCKLWEESINPVETLGIRLVKFRTGIVLSKNGGALTEFAKPLKLGIATIFGSGNQTVSWVHSEDLCNMYLFAIENNLLQGVFNAVAPQPVTNKQLILTLAKIKRNKFFIPVHIPAFILKFILGEMSIEILKSVNVSSQKVQQQGFSFSFASIENAFKNLLN